MHGSNNGAGRVLSAQQNAQPEPAVRNELWIRSERSIVASGLLGTPGPGGEICAIQGFQTWEASDIYRLDYQAMYTETAGTDLDIGLFINSVLYFKLLVPATTFMPDYGTLWLAPNSDKISLNAITGSNGTYIGKLTLTRMQQGFRAG